MTARSVPVMPNFFAGQKLTGTLMNQVGTYGVFWADQPMFRMYQTVAQSVASSANTQILMDTSEYDSDTGRGGSSPYSYVIPPGMTGRWYFATMISWAANATGVRIAQIFRNGTIINGVQQAVLAAPAANVTNVFISATVAVNAGDVISASGWQQSGGALLTNVGNGFPSFFEGHLASLASP